MAWWREAKFGMFIHWGLYALPAGEWKGKQIPGLGEWIMARAKIPREEYAQLAADFNPGKFDAKEWVEAANKAGMKYIVITAKHCEGFAMYHSRVNPYNIVDATPFKRDPMKELAEECAQVGLKLCFYYAQTKDWNESDADGNNWEFSVAGSEEFVNYLERKVKPQVRELLTQYGPIGLIWFDTPGRMTAEQSKQLVDLVHELQPECIVNGRVGNEMGDYICLRDNETPAHPLRADWETCATLNHTWGFKKKDRLWKSPDTLIRLLCDIVGKGGTYLLNVGPTAEGVIPEASVNILAEVGKWLQVNEEAIRGTQANPYDSEFDWGTITWRPGKVYVHLFGVGPGGSGKSVFELYGLKNVVKRTYFLEGPREELNVEQSFDSATETHSLQVDLVDRVPASSVAVLVLEVDGDVKVDNSIGQRADRDIVLEAHQADIHKTGAESQIGLERAGNVSQWTHPGDSLNWRFKVVHPGTYRIRVRSIAEKAQEAIGETVGRWVGGQRFVMETAGKTIHCTVQEDERIADTRSLYFNRIHSFCGTVEFTMPGEYTLKMKLEHAVVDRGKETGLKLFSVDLV
jgi:alpha-L-fucosidase